jgi:hypothetical protein
MANENNHTLDVSSEEEQLAAEEIQQKNELLPAVEASLIFSYHGGGWLANIT